MYQVEFSQNESDAGLAPKIFLLKYFVRCFDHVSQVQNCFTHYRIHWYGNAFNMQYWLLSVNGSFVD